MIVRQIKDSLLYSSVCLFICIYNAFTSYVIKTFSNLVIPKQVFNIWFDLATNKTTFSFY